MDEYYLENIMQPKDIIALHAMQKSHIPVRDVHFILTPIHIYMLQWQTFEKYFQAIIFATDCPKPEIVSVPVGQGLDPDILETDALVMHFWLA